MIEILWVEDNIEIVESTRSIAEKFDIVLDLANSLETAKTKLRAKYDDYSAVILDCYCPITEGAPASDRFLSEAIKAVEIESSKHTNVMPWYVYSGGNRAEYVGVDYQVQESRKSWDASWPWNYYKKESVIDISNLDDRYILNEDNDIVLEESNEFVGPNEETHLICLMHRIRNVASNKKANHIQGKYKEVFDVIEKYNFGRESKKTLLDILLAMNYPQEYKHFTPENYFNSIRKIIEKMFRAFYQLGIIPEVCIEGIDLSKNIPGKVNLAECSEFLSGRPTSHTKVQYDGTPIFPKFISESTWSIIKAGNIKSHTTELTEEDILCVVEYFGNSSPYTLYGYTMMLCGILSWFGLYASTQKGHEDENRRKCISADNTEKDQSPKSISNTDKNTYMNKSFVLEKDEDGIYHCGECILPNPLERLIGKEVIITYVDTNHDKSTEKKYHYFAKYKVKQ